MLYNMLYINSTQKKLHQLLYEKSLQYKILPAQNLKKLPCFIQQLKPKIPQTKLTYRNTTDFESIFFHPHIRHDYSKQKNCI